MNELLVLLGSSKVPISSVIIDQKGLGEKNIEIIKERVGSKYKSYNPYSVEFTFPHVFFENHNSVKLQNYLLAERIDLLINAGTPRILSNSVLDAVNLGVLNVHPGLLPWFRGSSCVEWAILEDKEIGITCHLMDQGIDTGAILEKRIIPVYRTDSYQDIRIRVHKESNDLMASVVKKIYKTGSLKDLTTKQGIGCYYKPMPNELFEEVMKIIANGSYKYLS